MEYEAVIGLEVHAQLLTGSKIFCSCSTRFGESPNSLVCPVCSGMPGVLPVLNRRVVEFGIRAALATHCQIAPYSVFARKNYFYPDLPKGYQISQYELPLAIGGWLDVEVDGQSRRIGLTRIHMEEDAGKLLHEEDGRASDSSFVDLNRTGVPLLEIVSEPDIRSPEEASAYLKKLRAIVQYLDICDGNMEQGSFRCDANVSIRLRGKEDLGTKAEVKNMNSFKNVQKALAYEIRRQEAILDAGEEVVQETRLWNPDKNLTFPMRSKEEAHDYRYFPDPDLVPLRIDTRWVEEVRSQLPELPDERKKRFEEKLELPAYDAEVLTASKAQAEYFEECVRLYPQAKTVSNWIMTELMRELKGDNKEIEECPVTPKNLAVMLDLIDKKVISGKIAKKVFDEMYQTGKDPEQIVKEKGLVQVTDEAAIEKIVDQVLESNLDQVDQYRQGKEKVFGFFVGQVMKASKGKANPQIVNQLLKKKLGK